MKTRNGEYLAVGILQQIESLSHVVDEIQQEPLAPEAIAWRLRAVELALRRIREAA